MHLGVYSACTPTLEPDELINVVSQQGYAGIEWRVSDTPHTSEVPHFLHHNRCTISSDDAALDAACAATVDAGLITTTFSPYIEPGDVEALRHFHAAAVRNRVPVVRLRASWMGEPGYAELARRDRDFLENAAAMAAGTPVTFAVETHHRSIAPSASLVQRLVEGLDPQDVGVIYDVGNLAAEGYEDPRLALEILGSSIVGVHIKNAYYAVDRSAQPPWTLTWCPLGEGILDIPEYLRLLQEYGYRGWITVEDFSDDVSDAEKLARSATYLNPLLGQHRGLIALKEQKIS